MPPGSAPPPPLRGRAAAACARRGGGGGGGGGGGANRLPDTERPPPHPSPAGGGGRSLGRCSRASAALRSFAPPRSIQQLPFAVVDLDHMERGGVESHVIGRREIEDAVGADHVLQVLDRVAHLRLVGRARLLDGGDVDQQRVVGVAPEGRDRLVIGGLVCLAVVEPDFLLRIGVGQLFGDENRGRRNANAVRGGPGPVDVFLRRDRVAEIQRNLR